MKSLLFSISLILIYVQFIAPISIYFVEYIPNYSGVTFQNYSSNVTTSSTSAIIEVFAIRRTVGTALHSFNNTILLLILILPSVIFRKKNVLCA